MEKKFMTVLHEEEMLDDTSLDALKGGWCFIFICNCNKETSNCNGDSDGDDGDDDDDDNENPQGDE